MELKVYLIHTTRYFLDFEVDSVANYTNLYISDLNPSDFKYIPDVSTLSCKEIHNDTKNIELIKSIKIKSLDDVTKILEDVTSNLKNTNPEVYI